MVEVKNSDMPIELADFVKEVAASVTESRSDCLEIGEAVRNKLNERQAGNWQCIVSDSDFASLIRYSPDSYIKLKANNYYILLFKC